MHLLIDVSEEREYTPAPTRSVESERNPTNELLLMTIVVYENLSPLQDTKGSPTKTEFLIQAVLVVVYKKSVLEDAKVHPAIVKFVELST